MCRFLATTSLSSGCTLSFGTEPSTPPRPQDPPHSLISSYRESGSSWSWTAYPHAPKFATADEQLRCLSCYQYASPHLDPAISNFELTELGLQQWLDASVLSENGEPPCSGYKILQINIRRSSDIPVRSETFLAITKAFGVPPVELHISSTFQGGCGMFSPDDGSFVFIRRMPFVRTFMSSVLRYDPKTNITTGYILTDYDFDSGFDFFKHLHHQFLACPHPLLIPVSITELALESMMERIGSANIMLQEVEHETGFSAIPSKNVEPRTRNYQVLVRKLGEGHAYYSTCQTGVTAVKLAIQSYIKHLERLDTCLASERPEMLERHSLRLRDRLEYGLSSVEHALVHGNIANRLQSQQAVLFNLIAQADTEISIGLSKDSKELAAASKRDSSAMKIIAFLTALFLPGTFVAAVFAMPLFDWQAPSLSQIATNYYWFYWAVTLPLTLVIMSIVLLWVVWHGRQTRFLNWRARDSDKMKIIDEESGGLDVRSFKAGNKGKKKA